MITSYYNQIANTCEICLGLHRKGGDLEVCFINETILEEEQSEDENFDAVDTLKLPEHEVYDDEYHYEEDYWDHIKVWLDVVLNHRLSF